MSTGDSTNEDNIEGDVAVSMHSALKGKAKGASKLSVSNSVEIHSNYAECKTTISSIDGAGGGSDIDIREQPALNSTNSVNSMEKNRHSFEDYMQCSKSHIWKLMMSFYDRKGPRSWIEGVVPHFITSNAFIARAYVKTLLGYFDDCMSASSAMKLDPTQKFYIIELGTGCGKLGFYILKALDEMKHVCSFPLENIVFVMTDFTESNFKFWQSHAALKPYFDSGRLDAAIFDALQDEKLTLHRSGTVLEPGSVVNPICIVANYIFDTLHHDIFQIERGQLKEGLISTGSKLLFENDPMEPTILQRLSNKFIYSPVTPDYYSSEAKSVPDDESDRPHFRKILEWYVNYFGNSKDASLLFPIGALRALRRLARFSNNRAIILSGDKGYNNPDQLLGISDPHISIHGSFSMMVNYHAIESYVISKGGFGLQNMQEDASLKVACFIMMQPEISEIDKNNDKEWFGSAVLSRINESRSINFPRLCHAFNSEMDQFGPYDFFVFQKILKDEIPRPSLISVAALLKLSNWDPEIFYKFRDDILSQLPHVGPKLKNDLCRGIPKLWENYFILDRDKDIAFEIGRLYYGIDDFTNALHYYNLSVDTMGPHHITFHNQGLCYYSLGQKAKALLFFKRALNLDSTYDKARCWVEKLTTEKDN